MGLIDLVKSSIIFLSQTIYSDHVWAGARSCYMDMLDELEKQVYRTLAPSLAVSIKTLTHQRNVSGSSPF